MVSRLCLIYARAFCCLSRCCLGVSRWLLYAVRMFFCYGVGVFGMFWVVRLLLTHQSQKSLHSVCSVFFFKCILLLSILCTQKIYLDLFYSIYASHKSVEKSTLYSRYSSGPFLNVSQWDFFFTSTTKNTPYPT